jgi:hypothetical protein
MLKFDQNGGKYSAAYSIDFKNWLQFQDQDLVLPANAQTRVGFAQSSGNTAETVRAIMVELLPTR